MATPPTVLAAEPPSTPTPATAPGPVPARFPTTPLLVAVFAGIIIAALVVGGGAYWLVRTGRLPVQGRAPAKLEPVAPVATHVVALDPLVVNLADADGNAYLRVTMALQVTDAPGKKGADPSAERVGEAGAIAEVRDTALMVLGQQTSTDLLAFGGKERLKAQLKTAFTSHDPDLKVVDIFFTDFLVQR